VGRLGAERRRRGAASAAASKTITGGMVAAGAHRPAFSTPPEAKFDRILPKTPLKELDPPLERLLFGLERDSVLPFCC